MFIKMNFLTGVFNYMSTFGGGRGDTCCVDQFRCDESIVCDAPVEDCCLLCICMILITFNMSLLYSPAFYGFFCVTLLLCVVFHICWFGLTCIKSKGKSIYCSMMWKFLMFILAPLSSPDSTICLKCVAMRRYLQERTLCHMRKGPASLSCLRDKSSFDEGVLPYLFQSGSKVNSYRSRERGHPCRIDLVRFIGSVIIFIQCPK